ncbi:uncharacterized protein LOC131289136 [Anopheles ziemanni]|uniref:uncharacterized protein LOC131259294 n=1 Tax=Anopheles coustani TaxID=139045 RepID=UPI002657FB26|nr:uncharacterized protein LOC131259294 [Anopheles coustani]XP_058174323.1 uncharacterized protein LOC131289136 [Anopheles ziemanni]
MPRSYSRSPSRSGKSDRKDKYTTHRRSRSKSRDYDKYHRKDKNDKKRRRERSKSRSVASSSSYARKASYRSRSRDRKYKETSRRTSRDRYRRRKSTDRDRYRRSSSSTSSSSSSSSSTSRSSASRSSSQSSKKSSPTVPTTKQSLAKEYVFKSLEDACDEPSEKTSKLQKLNADEFIPQTFVSSRKVPPESVSTNIVIDLESQTIKVPTVEKSVPEEDPIFHPSFFSGDDNERMARWVKKLHGLRQSLA